MKVSIINDDEIELVLEVDQCVVNNGLIELQYKNEQDLKNAVNRLSNFNLALYKDKTKRYFVDYSANCLYIYNQVITIKN